MTLNELISEVYTLTNRPDLAAQTTSAVKSATLKMHQLDFWDKDIFETGVAFSTEDFIQQFEYLTLIPNWRAAKYFKPITATGEPLIRSSDPKDIGFDIVKPEQLLDSYGDERVNVAYLAGSVFNFRCMVKFQYMIVSCYVNPQVTSPGYSSWIAEEYPYSIIFEAANIISKFSGLNEEAKYFENLRNEQILLIRTGNVSAKGE